LVAGQCRLRFTLRTMRIRVSLGMVSASHLHLVGVGTVTSGLFNILASTTIEVCAALSNTRMKLSRAVGAVVCARGEITEVRTVLAAGELALAAYAQGR
jgi:dihydrodipicolinate synthase/N-acetylneuraminate lyase